jgi:hypothetical protein
VTGAHGAMRHMGNATVGDLDKPASMITAETLNLKSVAGRFDTSGYLSAHSDIVALLVFEHLSAAGPRDRRGRSLRDLDLTTRLLRYPCSYMIYSAAFDGLPTVVREAIYRRLWHVLSGRDRSPRYASLSVEDRRAIIEILRETKPDLPDDWAASTALAGAGWAEGKRSASRVEYRQRPAHAQSAAVARRGADR